MEEWKKLPLIQLKRLVKSRAGRIAELQMEIRILQGIIDSKIANGDLGDSPETRKENPKENPKEKEEAASESESKNENQPSGNEFKKDIKPSSSHAFQEI